MEITVSYKRMVPWETQPVEVQTYDAPPKNELVTLTLTDEVAASSYGVPVLVDDSGRCYGPADHLPGSDQAHASADLGLCEEYLYGDAAAQKFIERFLAAQP